MGMAERLMNASVFGLLIRSSDARLIPVHPRLTGVYVTLTL